MENEPSQRGFVRSTARVSAGTMTSRILGMLRMSVMSGLFGASDANDAFVAAFKIPNLLRDMFAEGALSAAFIPVFASKIRQAGKSAAFRIANLMLSFLLIATGLFVLLGILASPQIVRLLAPGFEDVVGKFDLTVMLARVMMPFLTLISIAALLMGMLNSLGKFGTPAFAPTLLNVGMIASGLILCPLVDPPILGMAIGVLIGGVGQCAAQLPQLVREGFRFSFRLDLRNSDFLQILKLAGPMVIGLAATQVNVFVITNLASSLSGGAVSYLDYAYRLLHLPLGLFAVAIGTVILPGASRLAATGDREQLGLLYARALRFSLFLILPAQAILLFGNEPIVALLYQHREFGPVDSANTSAALFYYSLGLTAFSLVRITVPMFYALKSTKTPVAVSILTVGVNIGLCFILKEYLDFKGLCLAVAVSGWLNFLLLFMMLSQRIDFKAVKDSLYGIVTLLIQGVVVGALLVLSRIFFAQQVAGGGKFLWLMQSTGIVLGVIFVHLLTARFIRLPEFFLLFGLFRKRRCHYTQPFTCWCYSWLEF